MIDLRLDVTTFAHKKNAYGSRRAWSLDETRRQLVRHREREQKDGELWSPATYAGDHRTNENAEAFSALVLDFDKGAGSWAPYVPRWIDLGLEFGIHTTWQHTDEVPRWRAVFPLAEPVAAGAWRETYAGLLRLLAPAIDDPHPDEARVYFLPSHPVGANPYSEWFPGERFLLASDALPAPEVQLSIVRAIETPTIVASGTPSFDAPEGDLRPGDDFDRRATWGEILAPFGWTLVGAVGRETRWTRPGKDPKDGISARSGPKRLGERFWCDSSAPEVAPIVPQHQYTKFGLYAALNHGGDHAAAARDLARRGFGSRTSPPAIPPARPTAPDPDRPEPPPFQATDLGNAERLLALYGADLRFCHAWRCWFVWDGRRWKADDRGNAPAIQKAVQMVKDLAIEATRDPDESDAAKKLKWAGACQERRRLENAVELLKHLEGVPVSTDDLDQDRWALNVLNGTLDLRTGELRPHRREDLLTRLVETEYDADPTFDPDRQCPTWVRFLSDVMDGDEEKLNFLWKAVGYSLTGSVSEQVFFFLYGNTGNNGKSTFMDALLSLVGDYGKGTPTETLMAKFGDPGVSNDLARLKEARIVSASETEDGKRLNEQLIKQMTGGDVITARMLHREFFDFRPQFKIWMTGNHRPTIRGTDDAIWRRVALIPFDVTVPVERRDRELGDKLAKERPGMLRWAVEGALAWRDEGLQRPKAITDAVADYRGSSDLIGGFLSEETTEGEGLFVECKRLYARYVDWCKSSGEKPVTQKRFGITMKERGEASVPHPRNRALGAVHMGRTLIDRQALEGMAEG